MWNINILYLKHSCVWLHFFVRSVKFSGDDELYFHREGKHHNLLNAEHERESHQDERSYEELQHSRTEEEKRGLVQVSVSDDCEPAFLSSGMKAVQMWLLHCKASVYLYTDTQEIHQKGPKIEKNAFILKGV